MTNTVDAPMLAEAFSEAPQGLLVGDLRDPSLSVIAVNGALVAASGVSSARWVGNRPWFIDFVAPGDEPHVTLTALLRREGRVVRVLQATRPDGTRWVVELSISALHAESGEATHYVASHVDVTRWSVAQDTSTFDVLQHVSRDDAVASHLSMALGHARRHGRLCAVLMVDIDRFDRLRTSFGNRATHELVRALGQRITRRLREDDFVSRLGDTKLAVVLADIAAPSDVADLAQRTLEAFVEPMTIDGREVFLTASIGATAFPMDGQDAETLLRGAEIALQRAKDRGGNTCHFFTLSLQRRLMKRLDIEAGLRNALVSNELELFYQPKVSLGTGELSGMEALLRWNRPGAGVVSPSEFIPVAEESDLIVLVGEWVLRSACAQARAWWESGLPPKRVSVNISSRHFRHRKLIPSILDALARAELDPSHIEIELTESTLMVMEGDPIQSLSDLRAMGVHLSIDDFGTGYSSLAYLRRLPIDSVKIDRAFIRLIDRDPKDREIVRAILNMSRALDMTTVAEGVETEAQLQVLRDLGCDEIQGFLIAQPLSAHRMGSMMRDDSAESFVRRVTDPAVPRLGVAPSEITQDGSVDEDSDETLAVG